MIGQKIGQYRVIEQIGLGGMATVYKAYQSSMDRFVALKVLPRHFMHDPAFLGRFEREARTIARLEHARILPVYDYGEHEGVPYLVMRYVEGGALSDLLRQHPEGLPLAEAARLIGQIASALDYAHEEGVVHRDIKPSNALVDRSGNLLLTDFGIAKITEATVQFTGQGTVGTPAYMSPEQAMGKELTPATDVYSLGIVLYEMLTGRVPFQAETPIAVINAHIYDPLPLPRGLRADLPEMVERITFKALAKVPEARYQRAGEMAAALSAAIPAEPVAPPEVAEEVKPAVEEVEPSVLAEEPVPPAAPMPVEEVEPIIPAPVGEIEPTVPVEELELPAAPPAVEAPPMPEVTPAKPARRGFRPAWIVGGAGGLVVIELAVGLLVIGLAVGGVFAPAAAPTPEVVEEEEALPPEEEEGEAALEEEEAPPPEEEEPAPEEEEAPPFVTSNDEWTPHIQEFGGVPMALVPAGCFMMGSDYGYDEELPVHEQCFDEPFWIDVTEVTNEQYGSSGRWSKDNRPRESVDWFEAFAHCEARGARLPTEAEWEYAARGPDGLVYPWGNDFVADNVVYGGNSGDKTAKVGSRPGGGSWVGALDLSGNVWEWTSSIYEPYPYDASDGREVDGNSNSSSTRVLRGGSWYSYSSVHLRAADRGGVNPVSRVNYFGFRCALSY